jgi:hypothetical protein
MRGEGSCGVSVIEYSCTQEPMVELTYLGVRVCNCEDYHRAWRSHCTICMVGGKPWGAV